MKIFPYEAHYQAVEQKSYVKNRRNKLAIHRKADAGVCSPIILHSSKRWPEVDTLDEFRKGEPITRQPA